MKNTFTILLLLAFAYAVKADTYTFESAGNWNVESNWDIYPGTTIAVGDEVVINENITINTFITVNGTLTTSSAIVFTNDWAMSINGLMTNNGSIINNGQITLFGDSVSNGTWETSETGSLIVTTTGDFSCYADFTNDGGFLGYNNSKFYLEGNFVNNDSFTFNGDIKIKHNNGQEFINNDFLQMNGTIRLEGTIVNSVGKNFNINWSSILILADNSKIENLGTFNIDGKVEMSSLMEVHSVLGHVIVDGILLVKSSILEIL